MSGAVNPVRVSHAKIKVGIFLTFCLGLFVAMLFQLGRFGNKWKPHEEHRILFAHAKAIRAGSPVLYNGMDIGTVKSVDIVNVTPQLLEKLPPLNKLGLGNIPVTLDDRARLAALPENEFDKAARGAIANRAMILLVLDVVNEHGANRFRDTDEYRIVGSMMGDYWVEVRSGAGPAISQAAAERYRLGTSADMYADLGKSFDQVKNMLHMVGDVFSGPSARANVNSQLGSYDRMLKKLESTTLSLEENMPKRWNEIDTQIDDGKTTLADYDKKVANMQPKIDEAMTNAQKSIVDMKKSVVESVDSAHEKVASYRKQAKDSVADFKKQVHEYRDSIPEQVAKARELTEKMTPTVENIERTLGRADDQLQKGFESTRAMLNGYSESAANLQFKTFVLKTRPWEIAADNFDPNGEYRRTEFVRELTKKHYLELRKELLAVKASLSPTDVSDKTRVDRIDQIIRESDAYFGAGSGGAPAGDAPAKGGKKK